MESDKQLKENLIEEETEKFTDDQENLQHQELNQEIKNKESSIKQQQENEDNIKDLTEEEKQKLLKSEGNNEEVIEQDSFLDEYEEIEKTDIPEFEKTRGNKQFKATNYEKACKHYSKALLGMQYLTKDGKLSEEQIGEMQYSILIPCNLNLAMCYIKLKQFENVVKFANDVLTLDENNIKGLTRRGIGHRKLQNFKEAQEDFNKGLKLAINEEQKFYILKQQKQLKIDEQKYNEKMKHLSKKMIGVFDYSEKYENKSKNKNQLKIGFFTSLKNKICRNCCKRREKNPKIKKN